MALTITREGDIVCVREDMLGFTRTKTTYWYYDVVRWVMNNNGRENERPLTRKMQPWQIKWVQDNYLPKLEGKVA